MSFSVVGVDHTTCPVSIREPVTLAAQHEGALLVRLLHHPSIDEAVLLSTCGRTEVYLWSQSDVDSAAQYAGAVLTQLNPECQRFLTTRRDVDTIRHAFRVTSGLESQVIGEFEITGQVRAAVRQAGARGSLGGNLDRLFRAAVACSRRLRKETDLGTFDVSVASTAAAIFRRDHSMENASVLVLGTGRIARLLLSEFQDASRVVVAGRTEATATALAARVGVEHMGIATAIASIAAFDVVCCATRSRKPLLSKADIAGSGRLVIFDVSIPRNVEPQAGDIPGVTLYDVDAVIPAGATRLSASSERVSSIVEAEVHDFSGHASIREIGPIISALRQHVDRVREQELERVRTSLQKLDAPQLSAVETMTQRLIDRMFHHLVIRLRLAALTDPDLIRAADFFFAHGDDSLFPGATTPTSERARDSAPLAGSPHR